MRSLRLTEAGENCEAQREHRPRGVNAVGNPKGETSRPEMSDACGVTVTVKGYRPRLNRQVFDPENLAKVPSQWILRLWRSAEEAAGS